MKISKPDYKIDLSEDDLKKAIEYWLLVVHNQDLQIKGIKYIVGERTEGYGYMEVDVPYQEGVQLTCTERN